MDDEVEEIFEALRDGKAMPQKLEKPAPAGFVNRVLGKLRN